MAIDFLTVVFDPEIDLLVTQGKSMDLYFDDKDVGTIFVMINDEDRVAEKVNPSWWGKHSKKVCILTRTAVNYHPPQKIGGWETQQVMKILGSARSQADWCIVVDSKTWFVRQYDHSEWFDSRDRAKCWLQPFPDFFYQGAAMTAELLGAKEVKAIWPSGVPHFMVPKIVRNMLDYFQTKFGSSFVDVYHNNCFFPNAMTEFGTYDLFVLAQDLYDIYYVSHFHLGGVINNLADWQAEEFDQWFNFALSSKPWTMSIKPAALPLLTPEQKERWYNFLRERGL